MCAGCIALRIKIGGISNLRAADKPFRNCPRQRIACIGTHLAACDAKEVYHSKITTEDVYELLPDDSFVKVGDADVIVSFMEERAGDGKYLMIVNKDILASQTVTLTFEDTDTVSVVDDKTGELADKALDGGKLTLDMLAGDCALIKLNK